MVYTVPMAVIMLMTAYLWLYFYYIGCRRRDAKWTENEGSLQTAIRQKYRELPNISWAEGVVAAMFIVLVLLWFFRSPGFMPGWEVLFKPGYTGDAMPAMLIVTILFVTPMEQPTCSGTERKSILEWRSVTQKMPWGVVLLTGGGNALAAACSSSGLSDWLGECLAGMGNMPGWLLVLVLGVSVSFITEVLSNMAACAIFMPIMISLSDQLEYNPLYLMFPVCVASSFAFMLPVSSASSAVAFSFGRVTVLQMLKAGFFLNIISVFIVILANETWGMAFFQLAAPPWGTNATDLSTSTAYPAWTAQ